MAGWLAGWLADVASFRKCLGTSSGARPHARASRYTCPSRAKEEEEEEEEEGIGGIASDREGS